MHFFSYFRLKQLFHIHIFLNNASITTALPADNPPSSVSLLQTHLWSHFNQTWMLLLFNGQKSQPPRHSWAMVVQIIL